MNKTLNLNYYSFSIPGLSHKERGLECQDYSASMAVGTNLYLAVVADGVGSCSRSEIASKIAVQVTCHLVRKALPSVNADDMDFLSLLKCAMHYAANEVERQAFDRGESFSEYETTIAIALFNNSTNTLYWGAAGDSGVVALNDQGQFLLLSKKQNDEYGGVFTVSRRMFQIGKADNIVAAFCFTDGLLDFVVPKQLSTHRFPVHVPRAKLFFPELKVNDTETEIDMSSFIDTVNEKCTSMAQRVYENYGNAEILDEEFGNLREGNLLDDLSVAAVGDLELLSHLQIPWEAPPQPSIEDEYLTRLKIFKELYPQSYEHMMLNFIMEQSTEISYQAAAEILQYLENRLDEIEKSETNAEVEISEDEKSVQDFDGENASEEKNDSDEEINSVKKESSSPLYATNSAKKKKTRKKLFH